MGQPAPALPTFEELYEQIRALPEHLTGEILEPGVLRTMSRPGKRHRRAAMACMHHLSRFNANIGGSGWWIEVEAEVLFPGPRLVVPDLCGFRVERVPELPDENPLTILPDWCCEILSPSTARDDVTKKLPLYASTGVPWCWIVDPMRRLIEVFETVSGRPALTAAAKDDERVVLPPFDGEIEVGPWWVAGPFPDLEE
ncbi:MAG TPA: Uma2 family endonuclease [Polyangiaceae bacterium]|jgi:Uma2 family endonuclease|nr:Uma2 family endonuclease [Polyangiaceae bacterium]